MEFSKEEQSRLFIYNIINLMERHLKQPISIISLAEKTGYSRWYVQRKFCSLTGITMKSYFRARKLTEAAKMILSTDKKIMDIAIEYGYQEQPAFCRNFKKYYGTSPSIFRKNNTSREDVWLSFEKFIEKYKNKKTTK